MYVMVLMTCCIFGLLKIFICVVYPAVLVARSVFVLGLADQLLGTAVRLEAALHELSQNYYHTHIKNVRAHKVSTVLPGFLCHKFPAKLQNRRIFLTSLRKAAKVIYSFQFPSASILRCVNLL
jgi:hypothetical protein